MTAAMWVQPPLLVEPARATIGRPHLVRSSGLIAANGHWRMIETRQ